MALDQIKQFIDSKGWPYHFTDVAELGSIDFEYLGVNYHVWEFRDDQTYRNVKRLAKDLGVPRVGVIANKIRDEQDEAFIRSKIAEEELLGMIHFNSEVIDADRNGSSPFDCSPGLIDEIISIKERIEHLQ